MGQRVNYVVKENDNIAIYYHHWRANTIPSDLYLGEKAFRKYLQDCTISDGLMDPVWMEGCVIMDIDKKQIGFWAWEFENETSIVRYLLAALHEKWPGWEVIHLANRMYDAEKMLGIDYVSKQTLSTFDSPTEAEITNDPLTDEYSNLLFLIRQNGALFVGETSLVTIETAISYGERIIPLFKSRHEIPLPQEGQTRSIEHLLIDADNKQLVVNDSILGLWEAVSCKWPGYSCKMGCIGYLALLEAANITTAGLEMPQEKVRETFNWLTKFKETYDPTALIERLSQDADTKIEVINPYFFDNVTPTRSPVHRITNRIRRFFRKF